MPFMKSTLLRTIATSGITKTPNPKSASRHLRAAGKIILSLVIISSIPASYAAEQTAAKESELVVLTPGKVGTPNKIYPSAKAPELTVATYNIAAVRVGTIDAVARAIKALNADIIALSEVDKNTRRSGGVNQLEQLKKLTGMYGVFGKTIDFEGGEYGIAVLSRYPITRHEALPLPSPKVEQRIMLATEVQKPGFSSPIVFIASHLDWQEDPAIRMQQMYAINDFAAGNITSSFPNIETSIKILAGDFNDVSGSPVMQGFQRYWQSQMPSEFDARTWPAINPAAAIDHILTFKGQRWETTEILLPTGKQQQLKGINWPAVSDHLPLVMRLKLLEQ
jgi:endonuclease/exonuclease/phosphatase family metal-dependent hydrolase